jgi:hypothetical protein
MVRRKELERRAYETGMTDEPRSRTPQIDEKSRRAARLVAQLRENLKKRKAQTRARETDARGDPQADENQSE